MKKISIVIPTYNEEMNIVPLYNELIKTVSDLPYEYEIIFIDNDSTDNTRLCITKLCSENNFVKAIFNARNFGQFNSPYYGLCQANGDCVILMCADFQDPIELIPQFITEWEAGYKIVCGIKTTSHENKLMYTLRSVYYKAIKKMSDVEQIEHFTGFGLYDKSFIDVLKELKDSTPFLRGIVAELGFKRKNITYEQNKRRAGKTSNNFYRLYDAAMLSFTSYTKLGLRFATFFGFIFSSISFVIAIVYLILKLMYWNNFYAGTTPILIGVFMFGSIQLFFIGLLGEYIISINTRLMHRPLVIEQQRLNFDKEIILNK